MYFDNCTTLDEAKKLYRELVKKLHPDLGGDTASFQAMQNEFENFRPETEKFKGEFEKWNAGEFMGVVSIEIHTQFPEGKVIKIPSNEVREGCGLTPMMMSGCKYVLQFREDILIGKTLFVPVFKEV